MNLPNKLTILRIALTFVFMAFLYTHGVAAKVLALFTFTLAAVTDALDGYIAKKRNEITDFGRLMDPIADKILVLAALLAFVEKGVVPAWMAVIIIFREVTVTGLRLLALTKNKVLQADGGGKHKTVWQISAIIIVLIFLILKEGGARIFPFWNAGVEATYRNGIFAIMLVAVVLTLLSGVSYFIKNKEVYSNEKTD
ncbi:MAG: CDP-diacylglycerol--glycerol-3-phosphate 3-phosphatidyltransferase [Candidatus Omnitrophica bacterium]|jgi:CDP-diacylglycerol--glycerol-3-phosphate 3-phosphatidyltransferase|nr:CDP-diacylglycerol--glycerol-3-phosphate 3-phosphatidyltransferase [Candidatus Omnitrophota bacterium]